MESARYQPLEPIKPGAPYRARDLETAQTVLIHTFERLDDESAERIRLRAELVKRVFHPALVTLFDVFVDKTGSLIAACEFVPAQTLRRALGGQPINSRRALELVAEVADGVAELHARQFPHGALSTESVLQTDKGRAKVNLLPALVVDDASEKDDLKALSSLLRSLGGRVTFSVAGTGSAAVAAARLREAAHST